MTAARRLLVLVAFAFWLGGFTFYASVVVPLGTELRGRDGQGFLTRQVTVYLNLSGLCSLPFFVWDALADRDPARWRRWLRMLSCLGLIATLVWLHFLHQHLDSLLDPDRERILDRALFRPLHRVYLWASTFQWGFGVLYLGLSVTAWRASDRSLEVRG